MDVQPTGVRRTEFTFYVNPTLTLVCVPSGNRALFTLDAVARLTGVHPEMLRYYDRVGLLEGRRGAWEGELYFDENALEETRRIEHYRRYLGVGRRALPLLCALQREAERQDIEVHFLSRS